MWGTVQATPSTPAALLLTQPAPTHTQPSATLLLTHYPPNPPLPCC